MFRDRTTELTFRAGTVPETVPVRSLAATSNTGNAPIPTAKGKGSGRKGRGSRRKEKGTWGREGNRGREGSRKWMLPSLRGVIFAENIHWKTRNMMRNTDARKCHHIHHRPEAVMILFKVRPAFLHCRPVPTGEPIFPNIPARIVNLLPTTYCKSTRPRSRVNWVDWKLAKSSWLKNHWLVDQVDRVESILPLDESID